MKAAGNRGRMGTIMANRHNVERRWCGRSYKRGGKRIRQLRYSMATNGRLGHDDVAGQQVSRLDKLQ